MRKCERKNPEDTKVSEEGGGGSRLWSRSPPAAHEEDPGGAGCPPEACGDPRWMAYGLKEAVESPHRCRLWARAVAHGQEKLPTGHAGCEKVCLPKQPY